MPSQTHSTSIQTRFSDTDALGHINNASFATYAEIARLEFFGALGTTVQSLILANLSIDFRRQVLVGERVHIETWIEKLGTSSISVGHTIFANDERAADVRSVVVHFDYASNRPAPLAAELRDRLTAYLK